MSNFIYICSPYGGLRENAKRAHEYGQAVAQEGYIPIIPHVMWHGVFDDNVPEQRETALNAGLELLKHCDQLRVFGKDITPGMAQEINFARAHGIPVVQGKACGGNEIGDMYHYFETNLLFWNSVVKELLDYYLEQGMTPGVIKEAIKQTAQANVQKPLQYMKAILNSWVGQKIFTIEKLKEIKSNKSPDCRQTKRNDYAAYDMDAVNKILEAD